MSNGLLVAFAKPNHLDLLTKPDIGKLSLTCLGRRAGDEGQPSMNPSDYSIIISGSHSQWVKQKPFL